MSTGLAALSSVAAVLAGGSSSLLPWLFISIHGKGEKKKRKEKKKLCASLQNKALVKNSVCGRDSVLT